MKHKHDRAPFDWCNYIAALMSGALYAALAAAAIFTVVASIMATGPMTDMSLSGILKLLLIRMIALPFTFILIFLFAAVVTSGATLVFGSLILALVRGTRFECLSIFGDCLDDKPKRLSQALPIAEIGELQCRPTIA